MGRVDKESLETAWDTIYKAIRAGEGLDVNEKLINLFKQMDTDNSGDLEPDEVGTALKSVGIVLNGRQLTALVRSVDMDGDGLVNLE
eukprot:CAMPEP_0114402692 /NCGR_PEP_ID=MMETSP0102-20121206/18220_1 /TAXON_ID=38822 ORGANISM="Pteridomonas danica, Strain PT" /NCGR_SAMPLE_ID=MMETSP0102 /ASSEMBLY_ACC=CAM_ASM_000212 /LENGTH=86 /DNA_ID=CAMNT_0001566461 /DNA_START=72 /DNA_END=329 /DNA_ORIENTATION=+